MAEEWPRKTLPGSAPMFPEARQAIQRLRAGLTLLGEGEPGAGAGLRANRVGPLRPLPSAGLHCTRRCCHPSSPGSGSPQWACRGTLLCPSLSQCLRIPPWKMGGGNRRRFCNNNRGDSWKSPLLGQVRGRPFLVPEILPLKRFFGRIV